MDANRDTTTRTLDEASWRAMRNQQVVVQDAVDKMLEAPTKPRLDATRGALFDYLRTEDRLLDRFSELAPEWSDQLERGNQRLWDAYDAIAWDVPSTLALWQGIKQLRVALLQQMRITERVVLTAGIGWTRRRDAAATASMGSRLSARR